MNSLIIATGTNLGDRIENLNLALCHIKKKFQLIASSRIYKSEAVDYTDQPDFFNQVHEFEILPELTPTETLKVLLSIEKNMGRVRNISRGPRVIDIDILFYGEEISNSEFLALPHPRWKQRSFVVKPLQQLPFFQTLKNHFIIPTTFNNTAKIN